MASMIIHDSRLLGKTPAYYNFVFQVSAKNHIRSIVDTTARRARQANGLGRLHILCHGFEANWDLGGQSSMPTAHGGFGLQLGSEGI